MCTRSSYCIIECVCCLLTFASRMHQVQVISIAMASHSLNCKFVLFLHRTPHTFPVAGSTILKPMPNFPSKFRERVSYSKITANFLFFLEKSTFFFSHSCLVWTVYNTFKRWNILYYNTTNIHKDHSMSCTLK